jgi:hypothetical protein
MVVLTVSSLLKNDDRPRPQAGVKNSQYVNSAASRFTGSTAGSISA